MSKMNESKDDIFSNAKKIAIISIVSYVIIKQLFFFAFVDVEYWLPRGIINAAMLALAFFISRSRKLTRRQMSWIAPVSFSLLEIISCVLTGGDQMIYIVLVGCTLLSLLYVDNFGLVVTAIVNCVGAALCILLFSFTILGEIYPFEYNIYHYSGMAALNGIILAIGKYTIGTIIKSRKAAEEAREAANKALIKIETLMNNLPGMVFQHLYNPPDYTYTFVSEGCRELTGYTAEELIGKSAVKFLEMAHPDDVDHIKGIEEKCAKTLNLGLVYEHAHRLIMKDGTIKWVLERSTVLEKNPDGTPHLVEGYVFDITRQRELEAAELARLEAEAEKAYYDALTGIHNRRFFDDNLKRLLKTLSRSGGLLSLMMIDIDFFKK